MQTIIVSLVSGRSKTLLSSQITRRVTIIRKIETRKKKVKK